MKRASNRKSKGLSPKRARIPAMKERILVVNDEDDIWRRGRDSITAV